MTISDILTAIMATTVIINILIVVGIAYIGAQLRTVINDTNETVVWLAALYGKTIALELGAPTRHEGTSDDDCEE